MGRLIEEGVIRLMEVVKVTIELKGRFDLQRLRELNYKQEGDSWVFRGVLHRYAFTPMIPDTVVLDIRAKNKDRELPHQITFHNIDDWVRDCVDAIDLESRKHRSRILTKGAHPVNGLT